MRPDGFDLWADANSLSIRDFTVSSEIDEFSVRYVRARGHVHARTQVFLALCLRIGVAISNFERGATILIVRSYEAASMTRSEECG